MSFACRLFALLSPASEITLSNSYLSSILDRVIVCLSTMPGFHESPLARPAQHIEVLNQRARLAYGALREALGAKGSVQVE